VIRGGVPARYQHTTLLSQYAELSTYLLAVLVLVLLVDTGSRRFRQHLGATIRECA